MDSGLYQHIMQFKACKGFLQEVTLVFIEPQKTH